MICYSADYSVFYKFAVNQGQYVIRMPLGLLQKNCQKCYNCH